MVVKDVTQGLPEFPNAEVNPEVIKQGYLSFVGTPLRVENWVIGVLFVDSLKVRDYSREELDLLQTLADQTAIAVQNARSFERI